jgi:hypothetical protein
MASAALHRALNEPGDPAIRALPATVAELLDALDAPPRLAAHLRAVHHAAWRLTGDLARVTPGLGFDRHAVLFGAATHDIGKTEYPHELSGPGHAHEEAGYRLLMRYGVPDALARFARTHGTWADPEQPLEIEDLLVSLADTVWKGRREADLEQLVTERIAVTTGCPQWEAFQRLDDIIEPVAADAERLLAYQAAHPV